MNTKRAKSFIEYYNHLLFFIMELLVKLNAPNLAS